jgi:predicted RNA binding protein YcfA (HicA-like mRNA interferase family)
MGKFDKLVTKLLSGTSDKNFNFYDLLTILKKLGFEERIKGSHRIFYKQDIEEIVNLQPKKDGNTKPYQVKQVREIILKYRLLLKNK